MDSVVSRTKLRWQPLCLLRNLERWRCERAARRALENLDDHLRRDIGLPPAGEPMDRTLVLVLTMTAWR